MYKCVYLPESNSIRADVQAAAGGPKRLLTDRNASVSSVDDGAGLDKDGNMLHSAAALATSGPEEHVTGLSLGARNMLAHLGLVLLHGGARDGLALRLADSVLGKAF